MLEKDICRGGGYVQYSSVEKTKTKKKSHGERENFITLSALTTVGEIRDRVRGKLSEREMEGALERELIIIIIHYCHC